MPEKLRAGGGATTAERKEHARPPGKRSAAKTYCMRVGVKEATEKEARRNLLRIAPTADVTTAAKKKKGIRRSDVS